MPTLRRTSLAAAFFLVACLTATADEREDVVKKQKDTVATNLKKADAKAAVVETDDLLVYAALPEAKVKPLATAMQKAYTAAVKGLNFESADKLWPGKLAVVVFADPTQYRDYLLKAMGQSRKGNRDNFRVDLRGDNPTVLIGVNPGEKPTDTQLQEGASLIVAGTLLAKKAGAGAAVPDWLVAGSGRAAVLRADGNASKLTAYRAKVRALYGKSKGANFKLWTITNAQPGTDTELLGTSFAEYLVYGPDAAKFPTLLQSLKPGDNAEPPTLEAAFTAMEWKLDAAEAAWRNWVLKGK